MEYTQEKFTTSAYNHRKNEAVTSYKNIAYFSNNRHFKNYPPFRACYVLLVSMVTSNNWNWWKENWCHNPQHKSSLSAVPVKWLFSMWSYLGKRQHSVLPDRMGGTTHSSYIRTQDGTGPYPYPLESCDGRHNIYNGRFLYTRPNRRSLRHQAGPPAVPHMTGGTTRLGMLHCSIAPWARFFLKI